MSGLIAKKKEDKRKRLLEAANFLFIENGVSNTTISQICDSAGIAKGTFYLYFSDKEDILRSLAKKLSLYILENTYTKVKDKKANFVDKLVMMANELLDMCKKDPDMLLVLKKDFVWPFTEEEFLTTEEKTMKSIREAIEDYSNTSNISEHQILIRLYALISMMCSVAYSSIIDGFPGPIDTLKEELFTMIQHSF